MTPRIITVTLDIDGDGHVSLRQPGSTVSSIEAVPGQSPTAFVERPPEYDVALDTDFGPGGQRTGFQADFLGKDFEVQLPSLGTSLQTLVTQRTDGGGPNGASVLDYRGYSVVMHSERKFAIFSAANVEGGHRFKLRRPHDEWHLDPRIPRSAQVGASYYANNQFDRGHLTRYEDMEYGASATDALQSAADTLMYTNCAPQHAKFNQGKQLWQGLEQHVLEQSIEARAFAAHVFTGPVLASDDPVWERFKDIQYPLRYWKIAVALTSDNTLFAAGFILDQSDAIKQFGIEAVSDVPFTAFKTYQVPIAEIERLTDLSFNSGTPDNPKSLDLADPLRAGAPARDTLERKRVSTTESTKDVPALPPGYVLLRDSSDIILE